MDEDKFGYYTTSDARRFDNKIQALHHEQQVYEEERRREADFRRDWPQTERRKHNFTFTDIVLSVPLLVFVVMLCSSFSFKVLGALVAWILLAACVKYYVDKIPKRTRKICFWASVFVMGAGFVVYKVITAH
ncbi:TPA: hypothetical protein NID02_001608 [Pseudomonas aeruginosa]|nr:hypothetical protein [Pseudomonas aeruginosa]